MNSGKIKELKTIKENKYKTRLYRIYHNMKQRCNNPKNTYYDYYGGKGIAICDEWNDFEIFKMWANNNGYSDNLTIDRINGDLGYEPNNCRWITRKEQSQNIKSNRMITVDGVTMNVVQWSAFLGINKNTLTKRLNEGKTEQDFIKSIDKTHSIYHPLKINIDGIDFSVEELSIKYNINKNTIRSRIYRGLCENDLIKPLKKCKRVI